MPDKQKIWKFPLEFHLEPQVIAIPKPGTIVHVQLQNDLPTMWAQVDPEGEFIQRTFRILATGGTIRPGESYVGTIHIEWKVWHIFEAFHGAEEQETAKCSRCDNRIVFHSGAWWHMASAFSIAPQALDPFAAQLDNDHDPEPCDER